MKMKQSLIKNSNNIFREKKEFKMKEETQKEFYLEIIINKFNDINKIKVWFHLKINRNVWKRKMY